MKRDNLPEEEKQVRSLANAIADASDRAGESEEQDPEYAIHHPFTSGLNTQYKNLANNLNGWEENNAAIYRFESDRL